MSHNDANQRSYGEAVAVHSALPLRLQSVSKSFGERRILEGLSLTVGRGEIVSLLGPNGAGKSTTLSLVLGFLKPDSGSVHVAGVDVVAKPDEGRRHIAYIPENVQLYPSLSGLENLEYFTALDGRRLPESELRKALSRAGLAEASHRRRLCEYSKGMRQKAGIAVAMVRECDLLLLDEPTSGLDPIASLDFHQTLQFAVAEGLGVLMATHDLGHVLDVSQRVLILHAGRLVFSMERTEFPGVDLTATYAAAMRGATADA